MRTTAQRRKHQRQVKRIAVRYGGQEPDTLGFTQNISESGLLLQGRKPYPPNTGIALKLPSGRVVQGEIRWLEKVPAALVYSGIFHRMGVRFRPENPPESKP